MSAFFGLVAFFYEINHRIIEYKKNQNDNVINQGLLYLRWLLDRKADFEILRQNKKVDIEIDWVSPPVICVAESYNKFNLDTTDILLIKVEIFRYRIYDENILYKESDLEAIFALIKQSYDLDK